MLRGEREVLVSTVNDNNVRTKLRPKYTNFNLLDFDGNGIPELVINSKMSYWDEKISRKYNPIEPLDKWVNAYIYTVKDEELIPIYLVNDPMSSALNFHYIGFTDYGYKLYSELNMLFTGAFRTHELIGNEMKITDKTGYSAESKEPTIFRNNDVEVKASIYNDKKFEYHNGRYELESYPANEDNLKAIIDAYPAKIQKKPNQDWKSAYRNLLTNSEGMLRVEEDGDERFYTAYPPYNHRVITGWDNKWVDHRDIREMGVYDINNDGIPELIIEAHSPIHAAVIGSIIQVYTFKQDYKLPKLIFHTASYGPGLKTSGFQPDNAQLIFESYPNEGLHYAIYDAYSDKVIFNRSFSGNVKYYKKYRFDIDPYNFHNFKIRYSFPMETSIIEEDFDRDEFYRMRDNNLNAMIKLSDFMLPYSLENIDKILK